MYTPLTLLSLCPSLAKLVASYPGRLSPVFVACSTKVGESLVKLITCSDVPAWALGGCMDEWPRSQARAVFGCDRERFGPGNEATTLLHDLV